MRRRWLSLIQAHENHLLDAIKRGEAVDLLVAALKNEEGRKKTLVAELESLAGVERVASLDTDAIKRDVQNRVADVRDLLFHHKPQARQMLRKLLNGKLELSPVEILGRRGYRFTGSGTYERLFSGEALEALAPTVVAPTGFDSQTSLSHMAFEGLARAASVI